MTPKQSLFPRTIGDNIGIFIGAYTAEDFVRSHAVSCQLTIKDGSRRKVRTDDDEGCQSDVDRSSRNE